MIGSVYKNKKWLEIPSKIFKKNNHIILDSFSKLAILGIISGYLKSDIIKVSDLFSRDIDLKKLGKFLSYIVNHPNYAPITFNYKIIINQNFKQKTFKKEKRNFDTILCFSGGIDSTAGLLYCLDNNIKVLPIWINFGQKNLEYERKSVKKILKKLEIQGLELEVNLHDYVEKGWSDWGYIVPGRNFLFVCLANALFRLSTLKKATIYICPNSDEMSKWKCRDKSTYFLDNCSSIFSKDTNKNITVTTPFANLSKAEILVMWKKKWEKKFGISPLDTSTCYYEKKCGRCRACLQRTYLLAITGYEVDKDLAVHPFTDPDKYIKNKFIPDINVGALSKNKTIDFHIGLEKFYEISPNYLKKYFDTLSETQKKDMDNRKRKLEKLSKKL